MAIAAVLVLATGAALAPDAMADEGAYARLLATHVRSGVVNGIRLALVDYAAVKGDPAYPRALAALAGARPERLGSEAERLAFWINAYNLLAIKAVIAQYPTRSITDGGTLLRPIWKRPVGTVGDREYSLDDIEHGVLRKEFAEPRIHFAIVCASLSCPDLRPEPYVAGRLATQLDDATAGFLANPPKGVVPGSDGRSARVSSIFKWFAADFAGTGGVARFIRHKADPGLAARLAGLTDQGLSYLDYDWSLNDTARAR